MNFAFINKWDKKQQPIADITYDNHKAYCDEYGYKLITDTTPFIQERNGMWMKWQAILNAIKDPDNKNIDWFFWSDTDVLIMNLGMPLDFLLRKTNHEQYNFIASKWKPALQTYFTNLQTNDIQEIKGDDHGWITIHTGNFFIKNNLWSYDFIHTVFNDKRFFEIPELKNHITGDEIGFTIYYMGYAEYRKHIGFLPNQLLNTIDISMKDIGRNTIKIYQPYDFIFHASFLPIDKKVALLKKYKEKVLDYFSPAI